MDRTPCFVAIPLEPRASAAVAKLLRNLQLEVQAVKWVKPENLHLTIKFLGDVDNRDLPEACQQLQTACDQIEPFLIQLQGLGTFPPRGAPRVVWLGVRADTGSLPSIHLRLDRSLESLGRPTDSVDGQALNQVLETIGDQPLADMEVDSLQLIHGSTAYSSM